MTDAIVTDRIIAQGRTLVRAAEALGEIEPSGLLERTLTRLLLAVYKRRLRGILDAVPDWAKTKILNTALGDKPMSLWADKDSGHDAQPV